MHVLVTGAGIIGSIYGWALAEGGHDVVHFVRPGRATALRDGVALDILDRRRTHKRNFRGLYRLNAVETLSSAGPFELVIMPVKHYALVESLVEVVPRVDAAKFLLLTQNWRGTAEFDLILPRTRYVYGDAKAGGTFSDGTLVAALKAIDIGAPEGEPSPISGKVTTLFDSVGMRTRTHRDMLHYLWVQYAITGGLWAALVQAGNFDTLLNSHEMTSTAIRAVCECLQVVSGRGVTLSQYPEARPFVTDAPVRRWFNIWMTRWMFRHDEYTKRCSAHAFGDPVEVKTFYDDLINTGHDLGLAMPVMESYADGIKRFAASSITRKARIAQ